MRPNSCPQRLGEQALSQESVFTPRALRDTRGLRPAENMLEGQQEKVPPHTPWGCSYCHWRSPRAQQAFLGNTLGGRLPEDPTSNRFLEPIQASTLAREGWFGEVWSQKALT